MAAYNVDLCLCIDGSAGMNGILDAVKAQIRNIHELQADAIRPAGYELAGLRARVIVFRDYACDGDDAMVESDFFDLMDPAQRDAYEHFVDGIEAKGGSGGPQNALEAVALALRSNWTASRANFRRQVIMVFTNAPAWPLKRPSRMISPIYPRNMPANLEKLLDLFDHGDQEYAPLYSARQSRLFVFAHGAAVEAWNAVNRRNRTWVLPIGRDEAIAWIELEDALSVTFGDL